MDVHAYDNHLRRDGTLEVVGAFSSHWAACAAMIRLSDPEFRSLGGDSAENLAEEARMHEAMGLKR